MKHYVSNYEIIDTALTVDARPNGGSMSPKELVFHILSDNGQDVALLDIGFGVGGLGMQIRANSSTAHWSVDGIEGFQPNCVNRELLEQRVYRNVWHGLAQELPSEQIASYRILCLLDVIEHLDVDSAKYLVRHLLTCMADDAYLFISTPLWFAPQSAHQEGDLEEHLIGVPASSMVALLPVLYAVTHPMLVGGFVFAKRSLEFVNFFQPTSDRSFSYEQGMKIARSVGLHLEPNVMVKTQL